MKGGAPAGTGHSLGKTRRLLTAADYTRVFSRADARAGTRELLLLARRSPAPHNRLGLVVGKKNIRLAVQRNRIKRIAREFFRGLPEQEPPVDVIVLAKRGLDGLDNRELRDQLSRQWRKLLHRIGPGNRNP